MASFAGGGGASKPTGVQAAVSSPTNVQRCVHVEWDPETGAKRIATCYARESVFAMRQC